MMRKGILIAEMLAILAVLAVISLPVSRLWVSILHDIPNAGEMIHQRAQLNLAIDRIRQDIDNAIGLPEKSNGFVTGKSILLIKLPDEEARYTFSNDKMTRYVFTGSQWIPGIQWHIPDAVIRFRMLGTSSSAYGVVLQSHIKKKKGRLVQKRLANSHIFCIGTVSEPEE